MNKTLLKVIAPLTASLALMVSPSVAHGKDNGLECLAMNVYHEARGQGLAGQVAVMHVTLNRVEDPRFPNNICGVVYQGPVRPSAKNNGTYIPIKNKCQFSWWCDGKSDKAKDVKSWNRIVSLVSWYLETRPLQTKNFDYTDGAVFYHAYYVTPAWAKAKKRTSRIEDHIFYRWK